MADILPTTEDSRLTDEQAHAIERARQALAAEGLSWTAEMEAAARTPARGTPSARPRAAPLLTRGGGDGGGDETHGGGDAPPRDGGVDLATPTTAAAAAGALATTAPPTSATLAAAGARAHAASASGGALAGDPTGRDARADHDEGRDARAHDEVRAAGALSGMRADSSSSSGAAAGRAPIEGVPAPLRDVAAAAFDIRRWLYDPTSQVDLPGLLGHLEGALRNCGAVEAASAKLPEGVSIKAQDDTLQMVLRELQEAWRMRQSGDTSTPEQDTELLDLLDRTHMALADYGADRRVWCQALRRLTALPRLEERLTLRAKALSRAVQRGNEGDADLLRRLMDTDQLLAIYTTLSIPRLEARAKIAAQRRVDTLRQEAGETVEQFRDRLQHWWTRATRAGEVTGQALLGGVRPSTRARLDADLQLVVLTEASGEGRGQPERDASGRVASATALQSEERATPGLLCLEFIASSCTVELLTRLLTRAEITAAQRMQAAAAVRGQLAAIKDSHTAAVDDDSDAGDDDAGEVAAAAPASTTKAPERNRPKRGGQRGNSRDGSGSTSSPNTKAGRATSITCFRCGGVGHRAPACPSPPLAKDAKGGNKGRCARCSGVGHDVKVCPTPVPEPGATAKDSRGPKAPGN
jgi:hypothetical protein